LIQSLENLEEAALLTGTTFEALIANPCLSEPIVGLFKLLNGNHIELTKEIVSIISNNLFYTKDIENFFRLMSELQIPLSNELICNVLQNGYNIEHVTEIIELLDVQDYAYEENIDVYSQTSSLRPSIKKLGKYGFFDSEKIQQIKQARKKNDRDAVIEMGPYTPKL